MQQKEAAVKGLTGGVAYLFKTNKVNEKFLIKIKQDLFLLGYWYSWPWIS